MAGRFDFTIEQGATFELPLLWQSESGTPVDLTGYEARMKAVCGGQVVIELSTAAGIELGGPDGTITLKLSAEETAALLFTSATYDLEVTQPGYVKRLIHGRVALSPEYTK